MTLSNIRYAIVFNWRKRVNRIIEKPIHIRAAQGKGKTYFPTGIKIPPSSWDDKNKWIINHPLSDIFNKKITDLKIELEAFENRMIRQSNGEYISIGLLKRFDINTGNELISFNQFGREEFENSVIKRSTKNPHHYRIK